jgi:hypothetical protein
MNVIFECPLVDFDIVDYPMIMATFVSKSGKMVGGAFMIDTASRHNIMNETIKGILPDNCLLYDGTMKLTSFSGDGVQGKEVHLDFCIGEQQFKERFYAAQGLSFDSVFGEHVVLGILGVEFLVKHGLALDFENRTLHSSSMINKRIELPDYTFFFPQEYGFSKYGLPVVGMVKNDKEYVCLVDSGSNLNTTTNYVLNDGGITSKHTGMRSSLTSVAGTKITDLMTVNFDLLSIGDKIGEVKTNNYSTEFQVINNSKYIIEGTKDIPPVSAIIGAEFLLENKWVIDFSSGAVYSAKKQQK